MAINALTWAIVNNSSTLVGVVAVDQVERLLHGHFRGPDLFAHHGLRGRGTSRPKSGEVEHQDQDHDHDDRLANRLGHGDVQS